jgi:hypothetical protein
MQLVVGERLEGSGPEQQPGGYVVTGVVSETPWSGLYAAKKVFYNFDFTAKRVRQTDDKEWLDVFLRTIRYPVLDQADYVARRRALARAEVRTVLGSRHSNLWPEPIDLLELDEARDLFAFAADGEAGLDREPVVVFARPHGQFLPAWQKQILPLTSVLSVLAELLEFISQAHAEGLLLLGLAPDAVVIDALERVHYVGTHMALSQESPLLSDTESWARFFPPERFPRGFAAPECFHPAGRPDRRSDLYAWGCLLYSLLTGESPVQIAQGQGRPWALIHDEHFARLHAVLSQLPEGVRGPWAEQLGVPAAALPPDWPAHLLGVLRLLLNPNPNRRPGSVAELRAWLLNLPPPAIAALVALQLEPGEAKLLIDCSALEADVRLVVRRGRGQAPPDPAQGEQVYEGPARPVVIDKELPLTLEPAPLFYTAWTARGTDGQAVYSAGVSDGLWQPGPANLRRWAEEQAGLGQDAHGYPPRVAMVLGVLDPAEAARGLVRSASPRVRGWGLRRLEQGLHDAFRFRLAEGVLWEYLRDPLAEIRQAAALDVWKYADEHDDELLLRLLEALEAPPLDSTPPLTGFLRQLGLSDDRAALILRALEQRRPTTCPLCSRPLTMGERAPHLRTAHGYVDYDGDVIPYDAAAARLWERVLQGQDRAAHERLLALYQQVTPAGATEPPGLARYVADLQRQVLGQAPPAALGPAAPVALPFAAFESYLTLLRQSPPFLPIARLMLLKGNPRLRELAREALLPVLAEPLASRSASADDVWRALEAACPGDDLIEERLRLCQLLPGFGVDAAAVGACAARLQDEQIVTCPECAAPVRHGDIETHLRRAHEVYEFRGVRRSFEATRDVLVRAVCSTPPDARAWQSLRGLAADLHPQGAERQLVAWLYQYLRGLDSNQRGTAVVGLAEAMAAGGGAEEILPILLAPAKSTGFEQLGRRLALELAGRLPPPVPDTMIESVKPLLAVKELPRKGRQRAAAALLRTTGPAGPAAREVLQAYVAGSGKLRAIDKLHQLEQRFGPAPAIDELCRALEDEVRMSCPRCPTQLRKKDMVRHLWDRHRLVLDGQRVREPWRVLEDWAVDYGLEKDPDLLRRSRELAVRVDPEDGLNRLHRVMLRRGLQDREILAALVAQARARSAGLCPHCYHFIPCPEPEWPAPLTLEDDVLEGYGYRLEVSDGGLAPSLRIESPEEVLYANREPGRGLTRLGAMAFLILPVVMLTFMAVWVVTRHDYHIVLSVAIAAGIGIMLAGIMFMLWPNPPPADNRLVRAAWELLVPHLLADPLRPPGWGFLYGLAQLSDEPGRRRPRLPLLTECCEAVAASGRGDPVATACLAELCRIGLADLRTGGGDAIGFLAEQLAACFRGKASPLLLRAMVEKIHAERKEWGRDELRRLQVLIAARALEQGLRTDDLIDLGRVFPAAREVLGLEDRWRWLQLELLYAMSRDRAWERVGVASSVFDLAGMAQELEELLAEFPSLLLAVRKQSLHVTSRGVWFLGQYLGARPNVDDIQWEWSDEKQTYVIEVGPHRLRTPRKPRDLVIELKAWLRFYFDDFVPRLAATRRPTSEAAQRMWQALRTSCPECSRPLVPCLGDVGIPLR